MPRLKFLAAILLALAAFALVQIPDPDPSDPVSGFQSLPDADLRTAAEQEWEADRQDSALLLLDYLISNGSADTPAAIQLRDQWLHQLASEKSALGRLKSAGRGALTGEVDSFESLGGSTLADFVVYGDLRDLVREGLLEDDTDEFIVLLSAAGVVTTMFPPADPAVSLLKASKRTACLSEPLVAQLKQVLTMIRGSKDSATSLTLFKQHLMPVFELSKTCRNFSEFQTLMRVAKNSDQVKVLTKIAAATPSGSSKLAQIITVASKDGGNLVTNSVDYVMHHGQQGFDVLYGAVRKGPKGLRFVADHPTLVSRGLKGSRKGGLLAMNILTDRYQAAILQYGRWVIWIKQALTAIIAGAAVFLMIPKGLLAAAAAGNRNNSGLGKRRSLPPALLAVGTLSICFFLLLLFTSSRGIAATSPGVAMGTLTPSGASSGTLKSTGEPWISFGFFAAALVAQIAVWRRTRSKLTALSQETGLATGQHLQLLANLEALLDLPLFLGLGCSVFAFMLIGFGADVSRVLAYTSTVLGLASSVSLRLRYFQPLQERLIRATNTQHPDEP